MIALRQCVTDEDYEVWLAVRRAVLPGERAPTLDELKVYIKPDDAQLQAWLKEGLSLEVHTFDHPCPYFNRSPIVPHRIRVISHRLRHHRHRKTVLKHLWRMPSHHQLRLQ